jgi:hypothetical protein
MREGFDVTVAPGEFSLNPSGGGPAFSGCEKKARFAVVAKTIAAATIIIPMVRFFNVCLLILSGF